MYAIEDEAITFLKHSFYRFHPRDGREGVVQSTIFDHLEQVLGSDDGDGGFGKVQRLYQFVLKTIKDRKGLSPVDWTYDDQKCNVVARYINQADDNDDNMTPNNTKRYSCKRVDVVPANESDGVEPTIHSRQLSKMGVHMVVVQAI